MDGSYEREQKHLLDLYEEVLTDEEEEDPFADSAGEYGSDEDYVPSGSSAQSDESELSDLEEQTMPAPKVVKKCKIGIIQEDISALSADETQTMETSQNITADISEEQLELNEEIMQQTPEEDLEQDESMWEDTTTDIPSFDFDESTNCLKVNIDPDASPKDVFECLFTTDILQFVVDCTNNYGKMFRPQKIDLK